MTRSFDLLALHRDRELLCPQDDGTGWLTARDFRADVGGVAALIDAQSGGARAKGPLIVAATDRYRMLVACVAAWSRGRAVVLPPNHKAGTLNEIVQETAATKLLTDAAPLDGVGVQHCIDLMSPPTGAPVTACTVEGATDVLVAYTSGTTGGHHACRKTAFQLFGEAQVLVETFAFDPHRTIGATVPAHHLYGLLFTLLIPLFSGARFIRPALFQPADVRLAQERYEITDLITVPTHVRALVSAGQAPLTLKRTLSSGAVLDIEVAEAFSAQSGSEVIDVLGSTESGGIAYRRATPGAVYVPFRGVSVAKSAEGQLLLRSPFLAPGADWQLMEDRIELVQGGFEHLGRTDGVLKIGGKRVAVQELEARARRLPGVSDAAALVQASSELRGTELWLAIATRDPRWTAGTLKGALSEFFDSVVLPRRYRIVDELPRDGLGKVQRHLLERLFSDGDTQSPPADLTLPEPILERGEQEETLRSEFSIPRNWVFFQGHFPGEPIMPGVVQLSHIVLPSIKKAWSELHALDEVPQLKYKRPIRPGARLALRARRPHGAWQVRFELREAGEIASSGQLKFSEAAAKSPQ